MNIDSIGSTSKRVKNDDQLTQNSVYSTSRHQEYPRDFLSELPRDIINVIGGKLPYSDVYNFALASKAIHTSIIPENWPHERKQAYVIQWIKEPLNTISFFQKYITKITDKKPFTVNAYDLAKLASGKGANLHAQMKLHFECSQLSDMQEVRKSFEVDFLNKHIQSITYKVFDNLLRIQQQTKDLNVHIIVNSPRINLNTNVISEVFLKIIEIRTQDITPKDLNILLTNCKNLKKVFFAEIPSIEDLSNVPKLMHLEKIRIEPSRYFSALNFEQLLAIAPNVKKISAHECDMRDVNIASLPMFESLKILDLFSSQMTSDNLQKLLAKAPNISELYIGRYNMLEKLNVDGLAQLQCLKKFDAYDSRLTSRELQKLLVKAPNIRELNISGCKLIDELDELVQLQWLEKVNASGSNLTSLGLQQLLAKTPNIRELNISGCKNIDKLDEVVQLQCLEKVDASESSLTSQGLYDLLSEAPNIKNLFINKCKNINSLDLTLLSKLQCLERIDVAQSKLITLFGPGAL